jgi:choline-glycine betaine transporter
LCFARSTMNPMGTHHKPASPEFSPRAVSILWGVMIAATAFVILLVAVGWFTPRFLRFTDSKWMNLLLPLTLVFIAASGLIRSLRKRRP